MISTVCLTSGKSSPTSLAGPMSRAQRSSYTPDDREVGLHLRLQATVTDGLGYETVHHSDASPVVQNINDAPEVFEASVGESVTTTEDTAVSGQVLAATDQDADAAISYELVNDTGPGNGVLSFNSDGSYSFDPGADFDDLASGETRDVSFSYRAVDDQGAPSADKVVSLTVTGANDSPVFAAEIGLTIDSAVNALPTTAASTWTSVALPDGSYAVCWKESSVLMSFYSSGLTRTASCSDCRYP